jgi:hypothetical protein
MRRGFFKEPFKWFKPAVEAIAEAFRRSMASLLLILNIDTTTSLIQSLIVRSRGK